MKKVFSILGIVLLSAVLLTGCGNETGSNSDDTNNQSVYKTIDFSSYSADKDSTEFDELINKKVTFTNVPTLAGYLGKFGKDIACSNESSFTIEDDAEYTVTGVVTSTSGTVSVRLKDCTITKN